MKGLLPTILVVAVLIFFYQWLIAPPTPVLTIGSAAVKVELAQTAAERTQGLSERKNLPVDQGLLFIFDKPGFYSFWMKEMNFPIDIIWLDQNWRVADILKNVPPQSFPQLFQSRWPAQYVLEVNAGFSQYRQIRIGQQARFLK